MQVCVCWRYLFCPKIAPITELFDFGVFCAGYTAGENRGAKLWRVGAQWSEVKFNGRTDPALRHRFSVEGFPAPYNL